MQTTTVLAILLIHVPFVVIPVFLAELMDTARRDVIFILTLITIPTTGISIVICCLHTLITLLREIENWS
jgi:uncharacterized protein YqhQ